METTLKRVTSAAAAFLIMASTALAQKVTLETLPSPGYSADDNPETE